MRTAWKLSVLVMTVFYFVACSPVSFEQTITVGCGADGVACITKCVGSDCYQEMSVSKTVGRGKVDFLIVNDNSGSMAADQRKMATKFPMFLDSLKQLDYRIAMTTTDISGATSQAYSETNRRPPTVNGPSAINQNGALQNGNLIAFGNGKKYLEGSDNSVIGSNTTYFNTAIERKETQDCENSGYTICPSDDERGVFAANLAVDKNEFVRSGSHLAIIVLSNEDERGISDERSAGKPSFNTLNDDLTLIRTVYVREKYDLPKTLADKVAAKFPGKPFSVHPIIIKPGDDTCLAQESNPAQNIRSKEGYTYQELYQLVGGKSTIGSICNSDYTQTLQTIGNQLQTIDPLPFTCRPQNDNYSLSFTDGNGTPFTAAQSAGINSQADWIKKTLTITSALPAGTTATLKYKCAK